MSIPASSPGFLLIVIQLIALLGALRWSREVRRKAAYKVNRHLRVFVEQSPLAIAMFDQQMKYVAVSARWSTDYNIATPHVLLGRSHYEIFPELPERWKDVHRRCLQGSTEKCDEELFTRSDGSRQWLRWEVRPWRDGGQVGGLLIFSEDITSRKIAEERACEVTAQVEVEKALRVEADRLNRAKDEFLAMVSHELRTPLHAILGWIQVAKKVGSDPARLSEALDALERATHAQSQLVSDILDAQRMIRGDLKLCFGDICLDYVIKDAVELIAPQADEKRITVKILTSTSGIVVRGDKRRLLQCVCNLLSNAVKFSPPSSHIEIEVSRTGASVGVVVRDYGQGIGDDFLPRVFNRFEQEALEGERCPSGLGLGLAIVKGLIEAHGGAVRAESNGRGKGSVFTLIVPLTEQPPTQPASLG